MEIIPLGTNGFFPSFGRQTACYAVAIESTLLILDAGSGLFRFAESVGEKLLSNIRNIHLYLSHYHLDHTYGFYAASKFFTTQEVVVYTPGGLQQISEYIKIKDLPHTYQTLHPNFHFEEIREGKRRIHNYQIHVRQQEHRGEGSLAFRFMFPEGEFAYVTDSEPKREGVEFVKHVPLLLHEHDTTGEDIVKEKGRVKMEDQFNGYHVTTIGAALIAKEAHIGKLVLIHHSPFADAKQLTHQLTVAKSIYAKTALSQDCSPIFL